MKRALDLLATIDHGAAAGIHLIGLKKGRLSPKLQGSAVTLHSLAIFYNLARENYRDVAAHLGGIAAALMGSRLAHLAIAIYDLNAAERHFADYQEG